MPAGTGRRRVWLAVLLFYALVGVADFGWRLTEAQPNGERSFNPANIPVAFAAGLFWPIDAVARLLSR